MNVLPFPNRALLDAQANFDRLIERARKSKVFGETIDFDAPVWDLAPVKPARPSAGSAQQAKLYFTTHEAGTAKGLEGRTPMESTFAAFVKAIIVLREESRPRVAKDHGKVLRAARCLYDAMGAGRHDPTEIQSSDFMAACNDIKTRETLRGKPTAATTAYRLGQGLEEIAEAINRHDVCKVRISFSNPFPRIAYDHTKVDDDARKERALKMASEETIGAIIDASITVRQRDDVRDVLRMAVVELLACAPVRINELLGMQAACRRSETVKRTGSEDVVEYVGYAHEGSKGAPDTTKWIPSKMVPVAERALADIKRITQPYRDIASWMEQHPGRAYVAEQWRLADPETLLSASEVAAALGLAGTSVAIQWMKANGVRKRIERKMRCYRLGDIEAVVLSLQPKLRLLQERLSDFMFLVPRHYFRNEMGSMECVVDFVSDQNISDFISGRGVVKSVFERLDILDSDGKPYRTNTHALRHFLNTLAQEGMLSQLDIARWSGRKDIRENSSYDHTGGRHLAEKLREAVKTNAMQGPISHTFEALPPVDRESFLKARFATAHSTDIGMCVQDFSLAPCPSHGACAGCSEHVIVKGDKRHQERAQQLLSEHEAMLSQAQQEMAEGTLGAGPWVEHNERMVDGLKKALAVHADGAVADGTIVQVV